MLDNESYYSCTDPDEERKITEEVLAKSCLRADLFTYINVQSLSNSLETGLRCERRFYTDFILNI